MLALVFICALIVASIAQALDLAGVAHLGVVLAVCQALQIVSFIALVWKNRPARG